MYTAYKMSDDPEINLPQHMQLASGRPIEVSFDDHDLIVVYAYDNISSDEDITQDQIMCGGKVEEWDGDKRFLTVRYEDPSKNITLARQTLGLFA